MHSYRLPRRIATQMTTQQTHRVDLYRIFTFHAQWRDAADRDRRRRHKCGTDARAFKPVPIAAPARASAPVWTNRIPTALHGGRYRQVLADAALDDLDAKSFDREEVAGN
jgi:hypothetical protein